MKRITTAAVMGLAISLSACTTVSEIKSLRELRGQSPLSNESILVFDTAIDAYRYPSQKAGDRTIEGAVVRSADGRKVKTEAEWKQLAEFDSQDELSAGSKAALYTTLGFAAPGVIAGETVAGVVSIPASIYLYSKLHQLEEDTEAAYAQGRRLLDHEEFLTSLKAFDRARHLMPSLRDFSDVDYWRGLAFERVQDYNHAYQAYRDFLAYSESGIPTYFKNRFPSDPAFPAKVAQAKRSLDHTLLEMAKNIPQGK